MTIKELTKNNKDNGHTFFSRHNKRKLKRETIGEIYGDMFITRERVGSSFTSQLVETDLIFKLWKVEEGFRIKYVDSNFNIVSLMVKRNKIIKLQPSHLSDTFKEIDANFSILENRIKELKDES